MSEAALVEQIYAAPLMTERPWLTFLAGYRAAMASPSAQLMIAARRPGAPRGSVDQLEPAHAATQAAYYAGFEADNPIRYEALPQGEAVSLSDCTSRSMFERSRFYRAFGRDNAVEFALAILVGEYDGIAVWLNTSRGGTRDYSATERRLTARLAPHLRRALHFDPTLTALRSGEEDGLARLVVDARGRVVCASATAQALLAGLPAMSIRKGQLHFPEAATTHRFLERLAAARAEDVMRGLACEAGGKRLELLIRPLPSAYRDLAMVDLTVGSDGGVSARLLSDLYGLTPSEAEVARMMAMGAGTAAIARARTLSEASVRTYFKRIFEKAGVARQAELVALIHRGAAGRA